MAVSSWRNSFWGAVAAASLIGASLVAVGPSAQASVSRPHVAPATRSDKTEELRAHEHQAALRLKPPAMVHGRLKNLAHTHAASTRTPVSATKAPANGAKAKLTSVTGSISGVVTEAAGGASIDNVCVEVFAASDTYNPVTYSCTDSTGHYQVTGIATGQYLVEFIDGDTTRTDIPQWYNNKPDSTSADLVVVNGADVPNVNAAMVTGGWVSGTVTDGGGTPLAGVCVAVWDPTAGTTVGGYFSGGYVNNATCTDSTGTYRTAGLPAGNYQVDFYQDGFTQTQLLEQWYNNKPTEATADTIAVALGVGKGGIDAAMIEGGSVSGTVTDGSGAVGGAYVQLFDAATGSYVPGGYAYTDSNGNYQTNGVAAGSYKLQFTGAFGGLDQGQWYNNQPDQNSANPVSVVVGQTVIGINANLTSGGTITGTVTDAISRQPLAGICAMAYGTTSSFGNNAQGCSDTTGRYTISGLATDTYTVNFFGTNAGQPGDTTAYVSQYYPNQIAQSSASPATVQVTAGTVTSGIDDAAVVGATFSGTVTDSVTGAPLSSICVSPNDTTNNYYYYQDSCTDSSGHYVTGGVPTGTYQLSFTNYNGRYITQWYDNQPSQTTSQTLAVNQGQTETGFDAKMLLGGNITGTVTAAGGGPLPGICVTVYDSAGVGSGNGSACTDTSGHYTSAAVPAGTYKVGFDDSSGIFGSQYYNGKATLAAADPVSVSVGQTTQAVNASLTATTVPGPPTAVSATAGDGQATVVFSAPVSDGGSAITGYVITPSPDCFSCDGLTTTNTSSTVSGLTNGTSYTFTVSAVNAVGNGADSLPSSAVTPEPSVVSSAPGAPTNVTATAVVANVAVSYTPPMSNGGSAITGYLIAPSPACPACTGLSSTGTSTQISGLTPGVTYRFTVTATNATATGPSSLPSNPTTPTAAAVSPVSGSSTDPSKPAVASNDGTTATGSSGTGTVTVSRYPSNPAATPTYPTTGRFLDVSISSGSTFAAVAVKDCNLAGSSSLEWWNPAGNAGAGGWQAVIGHPIDTSALPACLTVTLDGTSSPSLSQLGGTIFGLVAAVPGPPTGTTAVAGDAQATVSFLAPVSNGGLPITGYTVTPSPACPTCLGTTPSGTSTTITGLTNGVSYTFTVVAKNGLGSSASSAASSSVTPTVPVTKIGFTGRAPVRVLDTRVGIGVAKAVLGAGRTVTLTVPGVPVGTTAVALNVTATGPTAASYLTVYPGGGGRPTASNLNYVRGQTIPNLVLVPLGPGNRVTFYNNAGKVDVVADLVGYFDPGSGAGFTGRAPVRVLDTRVGIGVAKAVLGAGRTVTLTVPGVPVGTTAVALNVTATGPTAASYLTVYPGGGGRPTASNLNYVRGQTIPNLVLVPLGPGNRVTFYNNAGKVDVVADLVGYFAPGSGAGFTGRAPVRVLDTRVGIGVAKAVLGAGRTVTLTVPGVPVGTTAVALNVTATGPTAASYLTVYSGGGGRPTASNLNYVRGQTIPNLVLVPLGPGNRVTFYNNAGKVDVVADLVGYYD